MRKWQRDQIDLWCEQWARERKKVFGFDLDKLQPYERLGRLSCTLGQITEEKVAAGSNGAIVSEFGHVNQNWPEVYKGISLDVHRAFTVMRKDWRRVMDAHYVWSTIKPKEKSAIMGITTMDYWTRLSQLKIYVAGVLQVDTSNVIRSGRTAQNRLQNIVATIKSQEIRREPLIPSLKEA